MAIHLTDEQLIHQYITKRTNMYFDVLYERHITKVHRKCLMMTQSEEDAWDYAQDIFFKVLEKISSFQHNSNFSTWLYSITINYCYDRFREKKRITLVALNEEIFNNAFETHDAISIDECNYLLERAIKKLSLNNQLLLRLKYEQGLNLEEIAKMKQLNISAVKMRLKRSKEKVREFYSNELNNSY